MKDSEIRAMVSYVVKYINENCPDNLEIMIHLIGHDEVYRRKVSQITESIIDIHDELFVAVSEGKKIEELTPKFAKQCEDLRMKMRKLVNEYISETSK